MKRKGNLVMLPESKVIIWNGKHYRPGAPGYDGVLFMLENQKKDRDIDRHKIKDTTDLVRSHHLALKHLAVNKVKQTQGRSKGGHNKKGTTSPKVNKFDLAVLALIANDKKGFMNLKTEEARAKYLKRFHPCDEKSESSIKRSLTRLREDKKL